MNAEKRLGKDVAIFKAGTVLDVFFSKLGWDKHARFVARKTPKGTFITQTSGDNVPPVIFKQLIEEVNQ